MAMREAAILWTGWERCSRSVPPSLSVQYVETLVAALTCMDGGGVPKARGQARVRGEGGGEGAIKRNETQEIRNAPPKTTTLTVRPHSNLPMSTPRPTPNSDPTNPRDITPKVAGTLPSHSDDYCEAIDTSRGGASALSASTGDDAVAPNDGGHTTYRRCRRMQRPAIVSPLPVHSSSTTVHIVNPPPPGTYPSWRNATIA